MRARDASGRTPLESARAYASIPPDEAETEGAWVWRWDAAAGGAGANWATCLHLLERVFVPGGEPNYIKKIEKMSLPYMAVDRLFKRNNQTKTHSRNAGDKCEEVRPVSKI